MIIQTMCSWCHVMNPATRKRCQNCGHFAQVPRMECECDNCRTRLAYYGITRLKRKKK